MNHPMSPEPAAANDSRSVHSMLSALSAFFLWLADRPGYKSKLTYSDADYFNLSDKDVRVATALREKPVPTLDQLHHVLSVMPHASDIEKRDRAMFAFVVDKPDIARPILERKG